MKSKYEKKKEAEERQNKYNALTPEEKIVKIKSRRGESKKELERVLKVTGFLITVDDLWGGK